LALWTVGAVLPALPSHFGRAVPSVLLSLDLEPVLQIADLRAALPQHQAVLRIDYDQRLAKLPATEAARVRKDVARYLQEHPKAANALNSGS
jgi:hypothetical protein